MLFDAVPRLPDFSLDVARIIEAVQQENPKCIFLTSPNNPDGRYQNALTFTFLKHNTKIVPHLAEKKRT